MNGLEIDNVSLSFGGLKAVDATSGSTAKACEKRNPMR